MTEDTFILALKKEFPKFRLVEKKNSLLMKVINIFLRVITFGKMNTFMSDFTTTIGYAVYTPTNWDTFDRVGVLRHERIHMQQKERYGLWFSISYLFLWLPIGLAYFRMRYEQEAYEESMRYVSRKFGIEVIESEEYRKNTIKHFTSAEYFWTWLFKKSIEQWYDDTVKCLRLEIGLPPDKQE